MTEEMTVKEAGRRGGETTKARYGWQHYSRIGKMGGESLKNSRGREFYAEAARKGHERMRELLDAGKKALQDKERTESGHQG